jgi:hypothetical protein
MTVTASGGGARGSRQVRVGRLARLAGCAAVSMVVGVALAAAPALGATAEIHILTNVSGPGPAYQLQAQLKAFSSGAHVLTITNPSSNASVGSGMGILTGVELDGPGGFPPEDDPTLSCSSCNYSADGAHTSDAGDGFNTFATRNTAVAFDEGTQDGTCEQSQAFEDLGPQVAVCDFASEGSQGQGVGGVPPGQSVTITYTTGSSPSTPTLDGRNLYRLEEHFDFNDKAPRCRPSGYGNEARDPGAFPSRAVAASSCTVPATPKIDKVQIHPRKHTARFHQKAKGATKFACELLHNGKVLFLHSCGPWKWYANPLRPGRYDYLVWGVNSAGRSKTPAFQSFRMS